jgi:hypothetical protein
MATENLRVLVLYGGDAATHPRHELLAWLLGPTVRADARIVAEAPPHTAGTVDDRVGVAMDWADKAIALVTADARSTHGAPNVIDEIARWRERKSPSTLCILRQNDVLGYSNHGGVVYVSFESRVKEAFESLRVFLEDGLGSAGVRQPTRPLGRDLVIDESPNMAIIADYRFRTSKIDELQSQLTAVLPDLDGEGEAVLRRLAGSRVRIEVAYGNTAIAGAVDECRFTREAVLTATLIVRRTERAQSVMHEMAWGGSGTSGSLTADEIAGLRASRILFDDPAASANMFGPEMLIRGGLHGTMQIVSSPIPALLSQLPRFERDTWETVRLVLVHQLRMSGCVEHIERLRLTVREERLVRIEFRGRRSKYYNNVEPFLIDLDRTVDL